MKKRGNTSHNSICTGGNSWKNIRRAFWRKMARTEGSQAMYGVKNCALRMAKGLAPQRKALVIKNGKEQVVNLSCELHHIFGIKDVPTSDETIVECWPHIHAAIDPERVINYQFIRWVE